MTHGWVPSQPEPKRFDRMWTAVEKRSAKAFQVGHERAPKCMEVEIRPAFAVAAACPIIASTPFAGCAPLDKMVPDLESPVVPSTASADPTDP